MAVITVTHADLLKIQKGITSAYPWIPFPEDVEESERKRLRAAEDAMREAHDIVCGLLLRAEKSILKAAENDE